MWFILLDYVVIGLFVTGVLIYLDKEYVANVNETQKIKLFLLVFGTWWLLLVGICITKFVDFVTKL